MTESERRDIINTMLRSQQVLRDVQEMCEAAALRINDCGESGLAFSLLMVKESIAVYASQTARFVANLVDPKPTGSDSVKP